VRFKIAQFLNLEKKNINFVSYIITAFNKKKHVNDVVNALRKEGGRHKREFIVIDDGSSDNTSLIFKNLSKKLPGKLFILRRRNLGASFSTNEAVKIASGYWIRLLDGDDLVTYKSTEYMLHLAKLNKVSFVYGLISEKIENEFSSVYDFVKQSKKVGLQKFIRNCPANSSAILISKEHFYKSGGCNESFVSPDQVLFLRLFSFGSAVFIKKVVAKLPNAQSIDRLSSQIRRSRYESILALINFCEENKNIDTFILKKAYKRSLSRANTYNKNLNKSFFSIHFFRYILSKIFFPKNYVDYMYNSLKVFTNKDINRPKEWRTGSDKISISKRFVK